MQDLTDVAKTPTERYIGRPITTAWFRMTTVPTGQCAMPGLNKRSLALIMGHSEATQQKSYMGTRIAEDGRALQNAVLQGVVVPER